MYHILFWFATQLFSAVKLTFKVFRTNRQRLDVFLSPKPKGFLPSSAAPSKF